MGEELKVRLALENLFSLAGRDLARYRRTALLYGWLDRLLFYPGAALSIGAALAGLTRHLSPAVAVWVGLAGAAVVGVDSATNLSRRAARADRAVTYLRFFTSEIGIVTAVYRDTWPPARLREALALLKQRYRSITAAIASPEEAFFPALLESPLGLGSPADAECEVSGVTAGMVGFEAPSVG